MDVPREQDQFERIKLYGDVDKARHMLTMYRHHSDGYRQQIEELMRKIGRIDERLGES